MLVAGLAIAALGLTLVRIFNGTWVSSGITIASPFGWTLPITTAFIVVGAAWLLLSQAGARGHDDEIDTSETTCASCGRTVLCDWRLCPYCTAPLDGCDAGEGSHPSET